MNAAAPFGDHSTAVMQRRREPPDSLDFFPTPPWATRAFVRDVLLDAWGESDTCIVDEPAAGEGHMAEVLRETFREVRASDVHDYGRGYQVASYVGQGADVLRQACAPDWVITNPPFNLAGSFVQRALAEARRGVAFLLRSSWSEGVERYRTIFGPTPPTDIWQYCERVPMTKGRWDPDAASATAYAWFCWRKLARERGVTRFGWLKPGREATFMRPGDRARFAMRVVDDVSFGLFGEASTCA